MKAELYTANGVPIIRGTNISSGRELSGEWVFVPDEFADGMPRCVVREGDLVFPHRGAIGEVALVPGDRDRYFLSTSLMKITLDRRKADPRYAAYYFKSDAGRAAIMRFASQVGTPGIGQPLTSLRQFAIPAPPVTVQRRIADLLSCIDDKIELNLRMAETLERIARALFRSWFIDFDPVRAKAEGRPTGLPSDLAALFPDSFDGGFPNGWTLSPLREQVRVLSGGTPSKSEIAYWGGDIPWVTPRAMICSHVSDAPDCVTSAAIGNGTRIAPAGSILVMVRGMGPHQGVRIAQARRDVTFNQDVKALVPARLDSSFLLYALLNYERRLQAKVRAAGHGTGVLPTDALDAVTIPVPPANVRARLFLPFVTINERVALARSQSQTLADLRDMLLPKLISGELRISEAEQAVRAVA